MSRICLVLQNNEFCNGLPRLYTLVPKGISSNEGIIGDGKRLETYIQTGSLIVSPFTTTLFHSYTECATENPGDQKPCRLTRIALEQMTFKKVWKKRV